MTAVTTRVIPGCEAFRFDGGRLGALLLHGFTGNPMSMRPLGQWLAGEGLSVAGPRYPGHGTTWQDLATTRWTDWADEAERGFQDLASRCEDLVLVGLSMGGAMACHLTAQHQDRVRGLVVINAYIRDVRLGFAPFVRLFTRSRPGVGNDIKKPAQNEAPYDRVPLSAAASLGKMLKVVQREVPGIDIPFLQFHAPEDHVVPKGSAQYLFDRIGSSEKEMVILPNSYHVATLDYDADTIGERTLGFARAHARSAA